MITESAAVDRIQPNEISGSTSIRPFDAAARHGVLSQPYFITLLIVGLLPFLSACGQRIISSGGSDAAHSGVTDKSIIMAKSSPNRSAI
jgi:hypothetical protein